ncbi:MAG: AarF/ABC1/UbiB kinase family protein [Acidobacteriota bacterium]
MGDPATRRPPRSAPARLASLGATGVAIAGRSALGKVRKVGAGPERQSEIDAATHEHNAARLFRALSELRGAAAKIGQLLALQTHTLPEPYTRRLAALQWQAPPMHGTLARLQIRQHLGQRPEEIFADFERQPLAAASLGQVHRARLQDGTPVAVKIQYPGMDRTLGSDLRIFEGVLSTLGWNHRERPEIFAALEEVGRQLRREADYRQEAAAMETFRHLLRPRSDVLVPRSFPELSTDRILTMELVDGQHPRTTPADPSASPESINRLAARLLDLFFHQTFELGILHADPHPGNFLLCPDGRLALLDFGCTQRLATDLMANVRALFQLPLEETPEHHRLYRQLGLGHSKDTQQAEGQAALDEMRRLDLAKYRQRQAFDFADPTYLRRMHQALAKLARLGLVQPEFVFYLRTRLGLYHLFHQLGARVHCRDIVRPYLAQLETTPA